MTDRLPGHDDRVDSPGRFLLSGWMVVQLLLAVFLIPAVDGVAQLSNRFTFNPFHSVIWFSGFSNFTADHANILWIAQVALVLNVIGCAARQLVIRWGALLAAFGFLLVQPGDYNYVGGLYLSLAALAGVWLLWDPGPLGWKMILGTMLGFLLVAGHYVVFARNASAYMNALLVLHYVLVGGGLLAFRAAGWRLSLPDAPADSSGPASGTASNFSFAHLFLCVTCCGLGFMLLKASEVAEADFLHPRDLARLSNRELILDLLISGVITPVMCLAAAWATLSHRGAGYWLSALTSAGVALLGIECLRPELVIGGSQPGFLGLLNQHPYALMVANNCLLLLATPTAWLLVYRGAGYRWTCTVAKRA